MKEDLKETIVTGKSTSRIISDFMKKHNLELNDFKFEVVEEGSNGFIGLFGAKPTTIKFIYEEKKAAKVISAKHNKKQIKAEKKEKKKAVKKAKKRPSKHKKNNQNEIIKLTKDFAEEILKKMNITSGDVEVILENNTYKVTINNSNDAGFIIGKEGKMLESIQHLLNQMINKAEKKKIKINIDVDQYRERRKKALAEKVTSIASRVKETGKSYTFEPLHASNRKVVHQQIEKDKQLRTRTIGEGNRKRVVILPAKNKKQSKKRSK